MSEPNFAGNIIVNLASLPDFLRTPILKKRMTEFFSKSEDDKAEIIINALNAGPTIPFPNFSKLFKTWLEVLATINNENREDMFSNYFRHILKSPEKIILFNLDAIFEIFLQVDKEKQQIGVSIRALSPNPWEKISKYKVGETYKVKIVKLIDYGAFCELIDAPGVGWLLHFSELSYTKKNPSAKKMFSIGDEIECVITEIDKDKRRVAISHKLIQENPFSTLEKKYPVGSEINGKISSINEYAIYLKIEELDIPSSPIELRPGKNIAIPRGTVALSEGVLGSVGINPEIFKIVCFSTDILIPSGISKFTS